MFVLVIDAVIATALAALLVGITVGMRQAHPTDLALQRPTLLAAFARRVLGLYVRRDVTQHQDAPDAERDAIDSLPELVANLSASQLRQLVAARSGPHAHEDHLAHARRMPES